MQEVINEQGKWQVYDDGFMALIEPSELWKEQHQPKPTREDRLMPLRLERDRRLNECDTIYCNADRWELLTPEEKALWRTYKQELRDLPALVDDNEIDNPTWPVMPGA
jgi:hypothetical protein